MRAVTCVFQRFHASAYTPDLEIFREPTSHFHSRIMSLVFQARPTASKSCLWSTHLRNKLPQVPHSASATSNAHPPPDFSLSLGGKRPVLDKVQIVNTKKPQTPKSIATKSRRGRIRPHDITAQGHVLGNGIRRLQSAAFAFRPGFNWSAALISPSNSAEFLPSFKTPLPNARLGVEWLLVGSFSEPGPSTSTFAELQSKHRTGADTTYCS